MDLTRMDYDDLLSLRDDTYEELRKRDTAAVLREKIPQRLAEAVGQLDRYCGGPEDDVLDVLDALVEFHDDRKNGRVLGPSFDRLLRTVSALDRS